MQHTGKKVAERGPYVVVEWLDAGDTLVRFLGYKVVGPETEDWLFDTIDEAAAAMDVMAETDEESSRPRMMQ